MADNLDLQAVAAAQDQQAVTINDDFTQLSSALTDDNSYDLSGGDHSLTEADLQNYLMFITTGNTVARTFTLPADKRSFVLVWNTGTAALSVACGTTIFSVAPTFVGAFRLDGTANGLNRLFSFQVTTSSGGGGGQVDFPAVFYNRPLAGAQGSSSVSLAPNRKVKLPIGLVGSNFSIGVNPTSTMTFTLYKNGSSIGTVAISTLGAFTVTFTSAITFTPGTDVFEVVPPGSRDATGGNICLNFAFTLV